MRRLKVGSLYRLTQRNNENSVPFIRLSGKWLKQAGFQEGDIISIKIHKGELKIRKT